MAMESVTLTFNTKDIALDIRQFAQRAAAILFPEDGEQKLLAQIGLDKSDKDLMFRYCSSGIGHLMGVLHKIVSVGGDANNSIPTSDTQWHLVINTESNTKALVDIMHSFIVKWGCWQWSQMFAQAESAALKMEIDELEHRIKKMVFYRSKPKLSNWE